MSSRPCPMRARPEARPRTLAANHGQAVSKARGQRISRSDARNTKDFPS